MLKYNTIKLSLLPVKFTQFPLYKNIKYFKELTKPFTNQTSYEYNRIFKNHNFE